MPDEKLLKMQWDRYGVCSQFSQPEYFRHLQQIYRSVHLPKEFIYPGEHFEVSVNQIEIEFLQKNKALQTSAVYVFCRSGFLSKIQIMRGDRIPKPADSCDIPKVEVIARMPLAE